MYSDGPFAHKQWKYPPADLSNPSSQRLKGDSGTTDNNTIAFIRNDQGADKQFEHFVPNQTSGLTLNGLWQDKPLNRGFRLLHFGRTGQHLQQYSGQSRHCQKHANRLSCSHRGLNKDSDRVERASQVSRRDTSDKGAVKRCCGSWCFAIALPHDNQHGKRCRLQQQPAKGNG